MRTTFGGCAVCTTFRGGGAHNVWSVGRAHHVWKVVRALHVWRGAVRTTFGGCAVCTTSGLIWKIFDRQPCTLKHGTYPVIAGLPANTSSSQGDTLMNPRRKLTPCRHSRESGNSVDNDPVFRLLSSLHASWVARLNVRSTGLLLRCQLSPARLPWLYACSRPDLSGPHRLPIRSR